MAFARERGAVTVAITDGMFSPLIPYADHTLLAKNDMASYVDSLVAPLSVINALLVAVGMKKKNEVRADLGKLEDIWKDYNVYIGKEQNDF
jgi:DNA-binding MurR/RpiR family transcriptional regulator